MHFKKHHPNLLILSSSSSELLVNLSFWKPVSLVAPRGSNCFRHSFDIKHLSSPQGHFSYQLRLILTYKHFLQRLPPAQSRPKYKAGVHSSKLSAMLDKKTVSTLFPGSFLFAPKPWERVTKLWARFLLSLCDDNAKCYSKMEKKFNPGLAPIGLSGTGASWSIQRMNSARWPEIMPSPFSLLSLYVRLKEAKKQKNNNNNNNNNNKITPDLRISARKHHSLLT